MSSKTNTKKSIAPKTKKNNLFSLHNLGALLSRARLMARLGQQYDNDRDVYEALGYPLDPEYDEYAAKYERQDIAAAIINKPVEGSWQGKFEIKEILKNRTNQEVTKFEKEWIDLDKKLKIVPKLIRLDKLAGLGQYGVLLLGLDDVKTTLDFAKPVNTGKRTLLYIKPLSEGNAEISTYDNNSNSPRYSLPNTYNIKITNPGTSTSSSLIVHHSRVIHVSPGMLLESEVEGVPRLKPVLNRLIDLEKLVGGSAEMFWRGARPGYTGTVDKDYKLEDLEEDDLQDQLDEYEHKLRRFLILRGINLTSLEQQIADPSKHVDIQLQMISSVAGIPKRILVGSERGELASTQDENHWLKSCQTRREEYINPSITMPFVDRCIEYKILSTPTNGYSVVWNDLFSISEREKAEIGKIRSEILTNYSRNPLSMEIISPDEAYKYLFNFTDEQIEQIEKTTTEMIKEEDEDIIDE